MHVIFQRIIAGAAEWAIILSPLMLYLLALGLFFNWSKRPVVVRGPVNLLGVLLGLSGFLLVGPLTWSADFFGKRWGEHAYWVAYFAYLFILFVVCVMLLMRQRRTLVIYNIEPSIFAEVLREVLAKLGVPHQTTPGRLAFEDGQLLLDIDAVYILNNVSLRWTGEAPLRTQLEAQLLKELQEVQAGPNPATAMLLLAAGFLFLFIMFAAAVAIP